MPQTFTKGPIVPVYPQSANLTYAALYGPEGASQTFVIGDLLTVTSGFLVLAAAAAAVAIRGVALEAGSNLAAGLTSTKYAPFFPGVMFYANLLGAAAADRALVATDMGTAFEVERSTTLIKGTSPGWYVNGAATGTPAANVVSFFGDSTYMPTASAATNEAKVTDVNPRLLFCPLAAQLEMPLA